LGIVPVAERLTERLREACPLVDYVPQAHAQEHSLEIQLPFLQVVLGDFELVPLVMGEHDFYTCEELAKAIVEVVKGERALLVASTDLSHFHPYPQAVALDKVVLEHVEAFDPEGLSRDLRSGRCEACGGGPMVAVMLAAKALGASGAKVLKYANSGDVTGDRSSVVGYMAAAIYRGGGAAEAGDPREGKVGVDLGLTEEEKEKLHEIARTVIRVPHHLPQVEGAPRGLRDHKEARAVEGLYRLRQGDKTPLASRGGHGRGSRLPGPSLSPCEGR